MPDLTPTGMSQKELFAFLTDVVTMCNEIKADYNAALAKLDADAGVTDVDYVATHAVATADLSLTGL